MCDTDPLWCQKCSLRECILTVSSICTISRREMKGTQGAMEMSISSQANRRSEFSHEKSRRQQNTWMRLARSKYAETFGLSNVFSRWLCGEKWVYHMSLEMIQFEQPDVAEIKVIHVQKNVRKLSLWRAVQWQVCSTTCVCVRHLILTNGSIFNSIISLNIDIGIQTKWMFDGFPI